MRERVGKSLMVIGVLVLMPVAALSAQAAAFPESPERVQVPVDGASSGVDLSEHLAYPAMTVEQADWMTKVHESVEDHPDYTSMAISLDRKSMSVTWHGTPSPELEALLAAGPPDTELIVIPSVYPGGLLRALLADAWKHQFVGFRIVAGSVNVDGSGIKLDVVSEGATQNQAHDDIVAGIESHEIPVTVNLVSGDLIPFAVSAPVQ